MTRERIWRWVFIWRLI